MKEAREDFVIVDGRPFSEYQKMNIPGGICCPNAELPYRIGEIAKNPKTKVIVNCAGRTRSILGAQTLINFGIPNPVYALENGTQGWVLADMELERGASRRYPERINSGELPRLRRQAKELAQRHGVRAVSANEVKAWFGDATRTTYLVDVRTPEEFQAGSLAGAIHAPGGQLVQATDQWVGVRNARIVLIDSENVRAPVVAGWLAQLGCDVYVLEDGVQASISVNPPSPAKLPVLTVVSAVELKNMIEQGSATVVDIGPSMRFRAAHIPGSRWSIRPRIANVLGSAPAAHPTVILVADDPDIPRLAAIELLEAGATDVKVLAGGFAAWRQAGYAIEASPDVPPDSECIDYLFFVHDRHGGNREAMRQYLAWETGLIAQLDAEDRKLFRVGAKS
jgi:rhodanese-related sulfurtransferase